MKISILMKAQKRLIVALANGDGCCLTTRSFLCLLSSSRNGRDFCPTMEDLEEVPWDSTFETRDTSDNSRVVGLRVAVRRGTGSVAGTFGKGGRGDPVFRCRKTREFWLTLNRP